MNASLNRPIDKQNPGHDRVIVRKKWRVALAFGFLAAILTGSTLSLVSAANISFTGAAFLTVGSTTLETCGPNTEISFLQSLNSDGATQIDSVQVDGIASGCDGEIVALVLYNSDSAIVDEIVWTLELTSGDTSIAAVADGTSTDSSNLSQEGISTNYPASQSSPEGLTAGHLASEISSVEFLILDAPRSARQ